MIFFLWFENQLILIFPLKKFYNIDHRSKNFKPWPKCCKSGRKISPESKISMVSCMSSKNPAIDIGFHFLFYFFFVNFSVKPSS